MQEEDRILTCTCTREMSKKGEEEERFMGESDVCLRERKNPSGEGKRNRRREKEREMEMQENLRGNGG